MKRKILYGFLLFLVLVAGCSPGAGDPELTAAPIETESPTPTLPPEITPTPLAPVGVFLTPTGANPSLVEALSPLMGSYLKEEGLRFQVLPNLAESDFLTENYAVVVAVPPFPELADLAASAPETKFLAVGFKDLAASENISVLGAGGGDYDIQGFIAGYIAALITTDWRVGTLSVQENPDALAARNGFRTGVKYYCGLCNPKYAPTGIHYMYPKFIDLPVDVTENQVTANINLLIDRAVNTYYIVPGVGTPQIYQMLIAHQKYIIGSGLDFREAYSDYWVASLEYDLISTLIDFWPRFLEAETGIEETPPLLITDVNYELLSEGKLILVEKILDEVRAGFIQTYYE